MRRPLPPAAAASPDATGRLTPRALRPARARGPAVGKGLGVYKYSNKYRGNIDTYAPIYNPEAFGTRSTTPPPAGPEEDGG